MSNQFLSMNHFTTTGKWSEQECPICGKMFLPASEHAWRIGRGQKSGFVCSYTCMRKWEKDPKIKLKVCNNGKKVKVRVVETGEVFNSITECAKKIGTSACAIHYCIYHGRTARGLHVEKVSEDA